MVQPVSVLAGILGEPEQGCNACGCDVDESLSPSALRDDGRR